MKYIKSIYIGLVGMLMAACQTEQWEAPQGGLCITLAEDVSISTKSTPAELGKPTAEKFTLNIVKESTGESLYSGVYTSQPIPASTGTYTVIATYGTDYAIALDSPYYKGEATGVEVEVNQPTPVTLTCKVANALASIVYGEGQIVKFNDLFSTYGVEVKAGNSSVTIGRNGSTTQSAYYRAGSTPTFTFKGTLKESNKNVSMEITSDQLTADAFQAGQHCKLTLSLKPAIAGAIITVEKVEVETVTISETIPVEWLPAPKINATGFDENKTLTVYETGDATSASIDFTVSQPLQDLSFTLNFADENLSALNKTYQLSTMTDEEKIALSDADITLPLIGSSDPKITFPDTFIAKLQSQNNGVVNNTITINSVTANNRTNADGAQTYTIAVHKPEFSVSVLPGNIWSKEFTVEEITVEEGKGNLEKIKENLVYQYQDADGNWKDFNDNNRHYFESHPIKKDYKIRAIYRKEIISSIISIELEETEQLPNAGMEEWNYIVNDGGWFGMDIPIYYPWLADTSSFWNTNNDYTTRYRAWGSSTYYNCFPAVSYTSVSKNGKAAEIRNTAAGSGNTLPSNARTENKVPGMLFIGDLDNESGTISNKGKEFTNRPSKLEFYYTYTPIGNDNDIFDVTISWLDADGEVINEKTSQFTGKVDTYTKGEIILPIEQEQYYPKASKIFILFRSSIYSGNELPWDKDISVYAEGYNKTFETWSGSVLRIDDISLIYDK